MSDREPASRVGGVLLAAGRSRRFGGEIAKQLLEIEGVPMVRRAATTALASSLHSLVVVVGHEAGRVQEALADLDLRAIHNPRYAEGQSTSVRRGVQALPENAAAALFLPCDQPFLTRELIDRLLTTYEETGGLIVAPIHQGRSGAPVLFDRSLFPRLEELTGDTGGRKIIAAHPEWVRWVEVEDPRVLFDIDTQDDLDSAR